MVHFTYHIADECRRCVSYGICVFADQVRGRRGLSRIQKGSEECKEALEKNGAKWADNPPRSNASSVNEQAKVANEGRGEELVDEVQTCKDCHFFKTGLDLGDTNADLCLKFHKERYPQQPICKKFEPKSTDEVTKEETL